MTRSTLTVHRATQEIGGNCIELVHDGHRLILDVGSPLDPPPDADATALVPATLDTTRPVDGVIVSHPHQDHYGLLSALPVDWPVYSGAPTEALIRVTAALSGGRIKQDFHHYRSFEPFSVGHFTVTPLLTDHSAFDAHMLLVEVGGRKILYSGDFRRTGRKSVLVDRMLEQPPAGVDVLLMEGTTLGRSGGYPTEAELELEFLECFNRTAGRVFVSWSAQNIDRTVTIFRACKRSGRTLVLDPYSLDILDRLSAFSNTLPRLGWEGLRAVVTASISRLYENPDRLDEPEVVDRIARSGQAFGAARLEEGDHRTVIMLRPPLLRDFLRKGVVLTEADAWVFSMWSGYLDRSGYDAVRDAFAAVGVGPELIHTSGYASKDDLLTLARAVSPKTLVPVHGDVWDDHVKDFPVVRRLADGEVLDLK